MVIKRKKLVFGILLSIYLVACINNTPEATKNRHVSDVASVDLEAGFRTPSIQFGPWSYWRWNWDYAHLITKQGITDDLEAMYEQGMGGVMIDMVGKVLNTKAPEYMSEEWLELIAHSHREANRLGLGFYIHLCDGWANAGGPWNKPEDAMKVFTFSKTLVKGETIFDGALPKPNSSLSHKHPDATQEAQKREEFYRDVVVLAYESSNPNAIPNGVINLTDKMSEDDHLKWEAPAGDWTILRFGWKITGAVNAPASPAGTGLECDKLGRRGIDSQLKGIEPILKILEEAPQGTHSLIGSDSWEGGVSNWTQSMPEEFKAAKGYDIIPWLPVLAGDRLTPQAARFQRDFNDMIKEMVRKNYIGYLTEKMHERGIMTQCQSVPEASDIPVGEYWAESQSEIKYGPKADFYKEDPLRAFAATSGIDIGPIGRGWGKNVMGAETFTSRCQNWERTPYALKSGVDWAFCSGINKTIFHLYAIQPDSILKPHYMEHGTAVNRNLTWWNQAHAWFSYIARSQFMLQRGTHVSDVCFIDGRNVLRVDGIVHQDFPVSYRFDNAPWQRFVSDMSVKNGQPTFPEGASYKLVVLPSQNDIRLEEIQKVEQLVKSGATILAQQKFQHGRGLVGFPIADVQIQNIANSLWGNEPKGEREIGKGRFLWGYTVEEALKLLNMKQDFSCQLETPNIRGIDWVHRRDGNTDLYFVVNRADEEVKVTANFRVSGKQPELWNPDNTEIKTVEQFNENNGITSVQLELTPFESTFVVFRKPGKSSVVEKAKPKIETLKIDGKWDVAFLDGMGAPDAIKFDTLVSWTDRSETDIKFYSGEATYRKTIDLPAPFLKGKNAVLDLGDVRDLVDVRVNGKLIRTLWKPPYRIKLGDALERGENELEITVANTWINRCIGDIRRHGRAGVKPENAPRYTQLGNSTRDYNEETPILPSGLLGPVQLIVEKN